MVSQRKVMKNNTNDSRAEKKEQEQKLEALLLKRLQSGETILHTKAVLEKIKIRVKQRIKTTRDNQKSII